MRSTSSQLYEGLEQIVILPRRSGAAGEYNSITGSNLVGVSRLKYFFYHYSMALNWRLGIIIITASSVTLLPLVYWSLQQQHCVRGKEISIAALLQTSIFRVASVKG